MSRLQSSPLASERRTQAALVACLAVFGLLRLASSMGDFYIDEIWSFYFSRQIASPLDVFRLNHDNNHILNTLYLYIVGGEPFFSGGRPTFIPHRLFSVVSGVISLFLVWKIASGRGRAEGFIALVLAGLSYPLVIYSSEARGYSPEIMLSLASFLLVRRYLSGSALSAIFFWMAAPLAFLSHSSFIYIYAGLFVWSAFELAGSGVTQGAKRFVFLHFVPVVFSALYYFFFLKGMVYGGGELGGAWKEVLLTASMALGVPSGPQVGYFALAIVLIVSFIGLVRLMKAGSREPLFFVSAIFIVPALIVVVMKPEFLYFRYFLVCFPFLYILGAAALSWLFERPGVGRAVFFVVMALYSVMNLKNDLDLVRYARGSYSEALGYMATETPGTDVVVAGDHDFRNKLVLGFYSGFFPAKRVVYLDREGRDGIVPDWFLTHSVDRSYRPPEFVFDSGHRYALKKSYGFAGVSGWSWFVYKKDDQ